MAGRGRRKAEGGRTTSSFILPPSSFYHSLRFGYEVQPGEVVVYRDRPRLELIPLVSRCNKISLTCWYTDEPVITEWVRHGPDHVARLVLHHYLGSRDTATCFVKDTPRHG